MCFISWTVLCVVFFSSVFLCAVSQRLVLFCFLGLFLGFCFLGGLSHSKGVCWNGDCLLLLQTVYVLVSLIATDGLCSCVSYCYRQSVLLALRPWLWSVHILSFTCFSGAYLMLHCHDLTRSVSHRPLNWSMSVPVITLHLYRFLLYLSQLHCIRYLIYMSFALPT